MSEDQLIDGLEVLNGCLKDASLVSHASGIYAATRDEFSRLAPAGEACSLAFPGMIIRPDVRTDALVAVFASRIVVTWRKGLLKKRTEHTVINRSSVTKVRWYRGNKPSTQGALLLEIAGSETVTLAVPFRDADHANWLRDLIGGHA